MKVLRSWKSGTPTWSTTIVCTGLGGSKNGCGALLFVEQSDLFVTAHSGLVHDEAINYVTVECCECEATTDIGMLSEIPLENLPYRGAWLESRKG